MENKMSVFVFDIDGTLSNLKHRLHYIRNTPKDWVSFKKEIPNDTPHTDIIRLSQILSNYGPIILCSAREETGRKDTVDWLIKHKVPFEKLYMRKENDFRDDGIVKKELLAEIRKEFGEVKLWFDDRDRVVKSLREEGVRVLQVAPGDF